LEVDHPTWHAGVEHHHRDLQRDRKAATVGWIVPRVSRIDVEGSLRDAVNDVALILRARSAA
jgi:very-short-patch-repair endonuclease